RVFHVTGVQTCALPIYRWYAGSVAILVSGAMMLTGVAPATATTLDDPGAGSSSVGSTGDTGDAGGTGDAGSPGGTPAPEETPARSEERRVGRGARERGA